MTMRLETERLLKLLPVDSPVVIATVGATALMASQVAAKAVRDAFFLSQFGVGALPVVVIAASLVSIIASVVTARLNRSLISTRTLPHMFIGSSVLLLLGWAISAWNPVLAAVLIYLQITVLGTMLISGFWSLLDDRFDPRSAKRQFGKIVAAGTLGGVFGGLLAARAGSSLGVTAIMPGLAALHLLSAAVTARLLSNRQPTVTRNSTLPAVKTASGLVVVRTVPYVRNLAQLILTSTMGAVLLDYVFKARAADTYSDGQELIGFFAMFYTVVGVVTFLVQLLLSRVAVDRLGVTGTVGSLPVSLALGSLGAMLLPGLGAAFAMRGGEAMVRSSLFKSSYEMLYAAVPRRERQATKSLLDVGVERLGDLLGALLLGLISWLSSESMPVMLGVAAFLGFSGFMASRRLRDGYVRALENNLLNRTVVIENSAKPQTSGDGITGTLANITLADLSKRVSLPDARESIAQQIHDLRSLDAGSVRDTLGKPLDAAVAPYVMRLLAWDAVAPEAVRALRRIGPRITAQLVHALLDPNEEFAIRRRVPRVLGELGTQAAVNGLVEGLTTDRFEVRFRCAQALAKIKMRNSAVVINPDNITRAVERELAVNSKGMVTMDHVFRLLGLIYPCKPLHAAHQGLESQDLHFRRTSLEYLENVLPAPVWQRIVPAFEEGVSLAVAG